MKILAIESSCDETSIAVIENSKVICNVISSQIFHSKWGGVVPELASRAHISNISMVLNEALAKSGSNMNEFDAIAVTTEPGLAGSLIVGANFAKGLSIRYGLPIVPVNHIEGHIFSGCLQDEEVELPFISLIVSGGHTALFLVDSYSSYKLLGSTRDDAAGEAFDKIATLLGLSYPGGPEIDLLAKKGNPNAYQFPRSMFNSNNYEFSFSGLKTSVRYFLAKSFPNGVPAAEVPNLCASVQEAIVDVLVKKSTDAAIEYNVKNIVVGGGVSANSALRRNLFQHSEKFNIKITAPLLELCMDNAAMIGFVAEKKLIEKGTEEFRKLDFTVNSSSLRNKPKKSKQV